MCDTEQSSNSSWVKNKGTFIFMISKQSGVNTTDHYTFASSCNKIQIFLNGVIYNNSEEQLIEGFLLQGSDYINKIEGSFVIFLIEGTQFHILTDKLNSKKAFYAFVNGIWYVSNNVDALPKNKCQLDLAGLACYLANGVMFNDLTLFKEIRSAKRASVYSFNNGEISTRCYWNCQFEYSSSSNKPQQQLQKELELLLFNSIKSRYASASNKAISLSGGYDSRGILGILHKKIKASNISCFSYALTENPKMDSDADVAKELAAKCGYPYQTIESYKGNLVELLKANAREGKCVSDFCIELDVWHRLAASNQFTDIFTGDEWFGRNNFALNSQEEILGSVYIRGASGIGWLENFISKKVYKQMCHCLNVLTDEIFETTNAFPDPQDKIDFLYIDQRLDHALMPWRENFLSQAGFIHDPYLDGKILEFIKQLPPHLRRDKLLFKNTIRDMLPDFFSMKLSTLKDVKPDLQEELHKHKDLLISLIQGTESRLDSIISKKEILSALEQKVTIIKKAKAFSIRVINYIRRRNKIADKLFNIFMGRRVVPSMNQDQLLLRLLVIRIYLTPSPSDN
jgi:asparagine synthase (glutamine-hydrolysing)